MKDDWKSIWNSAGSFSHTTWTLCKFWTQCSFHHLRMFNFLSLHSLTKLAENYKQGQLKKKRHYDFVAIVHMKNYMRDIQFTIWPRPLWSPFFMPFQFHEIFLYSKFWKHLHINGFNELLELCIGNLIPLFHHEIWVYQKNYMVF